MLNVLLFIVSGRSSSQVAAVTRLWRHELTEVKLHTFYISALAEGKF